MSEEYKLYLKKFKIAVSVFVGSIALFGVCVSKIVPEVQKISAAQADYKTQSTALVDSERRLEGLKNDIEAKKIENANIVKAVFKSIDGGTDTESVISDEFSEILQLLRENKIKARSIKYDYDPQDDNFVKNVGNKYHVCKITAEMVANYASFENFLRELYRHEHFLDITQIEVTPYEKNKRILLVTLQIKLYAQRDPSSVVETPAASPEQAATTPVTEPTNAAAPTKSDAPEDTF